MAKLNTGAIYKEIEQAEQWLLRSGDDELANIYRTITRQTIDHLRNTVNEYNKSGTAMNSVLYSAERERALLASLPNIANMATDTTGVGATITAHTGLAGELGFQSALYELGASIDELEVLALNTGYFQALTNEQVRQSVGMALAKRSLKSNSELLAILQQTFVEGIDSNAGAYKLITDKQYKDMAMNLHEYIGMDYRKARTILHNEMGGIYSAGNQLGIDRAQALGIEGEKTWYSNRDKRVRSSHAHLDGTKVPLDGYFVSNGHEAQQPHQFGVASEDINCRCRSHITRKGKEIIRTSNGADFDTFKQFKDYYAGVASNDKGVL